jgi:hypothetical protein
LGLASFVLTWLVLEFAVLPLALPWTPLRIHAALPRALRPLAQSSKAGTLPQHWIALLGDSYAQGAGDWLLSADASRNPPYHTAHLLYQATGRDVVSFGASGAGSLRAMGTEPEAFVDYLARTWRYKLPEPEQIVVYFYEGNDLQDNLRDLDHTVRPPWERAQLRDPGSFQRFVRETASERTPLHEELESYGWTDNLFLARFVARMLGAAVRGFETGDPAPDWSPGEVNRARIGGAERALPDGLQAPPLELGEAELDLALFAHEQAFALLRQRFPAVPVLVVYVPSPLSCYRITSERVDTQLQRDEGRSSEFSTALLAERGDSVCERVAALTWAGGGAFLDPRPVLWELADREPIHGPRDWKHFNRRGSEVLAGAIAAALRGGARETPGCASLRAHLAAGAGR